MKKKIFVSILILTSIILISNQLNINKEKEILRQDMPGRSAIRDFEMMKDPVLNRIPFERFPVAQQQTKQMFRANRNMSNLNWTQIPGNMGGRTKAICLDPNDPNHNTLWAGSATGGLWKNTQINNSNNPWIPQSDVWETLSISSIAFDPNNTQIMYVGTGEYETAITDMYRESSGRGYGIWKSTDDGNTFQRLLSTQDFAYISDLVIKNQGGQSVIYAGVLSGVYHGGNFNSQPSDGLYRSTDGGTTWEQVLPNIPGTNTPFSPSDIEISANGKIFVGTKRNIQNQGGGYILISDTGDPGTWTIIDQFKNLISNDSDFNIPGRVKLASAPSNPDVVYAVFAAKSTQQTIEGFPKTIGKIMAKTTNGGSTWQQANVPTSNGTNEWAYLAWHSLAVSVDPNNENRVFIGGLEIYLSTDGAQNWQRVSSWVGSGGFAPNYVHADTHCLLFEPGNSANLYIASDGGVFYSNNADSYLYFEGRNKSYSSLQFYSTSISKQGPEALAGGLQDNGSIIYTGNSIEETSIIQGGDGAFCRFDDNENILITTTYDNQFQINDNTGQMLNYVYSYSSGLFVSTFDYDSQNNVIWAIASDLNNNNLDKVLKITDILNGEHGSFINLGTGANKYFSAIRLIDNNNMYIGTSNGKLYKVSNINNSPSSQQIDNGNFTNGFISCIQTGDNGQRILVTVSNYGMQSVWQSLDGGSSWTNKDGNLPDMPVRWALYHPQNPNQVMLATETGVWTCDNINANPVVWTSQSNSLPNVRVDMLDIRPDNNKVVAGTHGRGLFTTTWDLINDIKTTEVTNFNIYPNPASGFINIKTKEDNLQLHIYDLNGKKVLSQKLTSGLQQINISKLKKSYYLIEVSNTFKTLIVK